MENILVVEGGPDYFAALYLAIDAPVNFRPVAILGATMSSLADATRPYLRGKKVLIIPHNDPAGQSAKAKWVKAFYKAGASKVTTQALPFLHDDLNEFLKNTGPDNPVGLLKGFNAHAHAGTSGRKI